MQKTLGQIKFFLSAEKPEELTNLMLENNVKTSSYHDYHIMNVDGLWYAWFELSADKLLEDKFKASAKKEE